MIADGVELPHCSGSLPLTLVADIMRVSCWCAGPAVTLRISNSTFLRLMMYRSAVADFGDGVRMVRLLAESAEGVAGNLKSREVVGAVVKAHVMALTGPID